jgi:uncharacterized protein (TIGR00661 family)
MTSLKALSANSENPFLPVTQIGSATLVDMPNRKRVIYGVQGTGNGHISRASAMNKAFEKHHGFDVTWMMSGRQKTPLMCCDKYHWYKGLTFAINNGRIDLLKTLTGNNVFQLFRDINTLSLSEFDMVVTDYEPVLAWAARRQGIKSSGLGHQYAFDFDVPIAGKKMLARRAMTMFAPVEVKIGMHWHHFNQPILPPIVDLHGVNKNQSEVPGKVLVYLPFENQDGLIQLFETLPKWHFYIYSSQMEHYNRGNIHTRPISKTGFKNDLVTSSAIICNTGFELISECLSLGKRIMTKPLSRQIEQLSNAMALEALSYANVVRNLSQSTVRRWLENEETSWRVSYPDVADAVVNWLEDQEAESIEDLSARLWQMTSASKFT